MRSWKVIRLIRWISLAVAVGCLMKMGQAYCQSIQQLAQQEKLREMAEKISVQSWTEISSAAKKTEVSLVTDGRSEKTGDTTEDSKINQNMSGTVTGESEPAILEQYAAVYEENEDLTGWLSIEGTKVDYPVMQCEDDEFYLHHDFYGEDSKYGCLYVREQADLEKGTNFIIYGHNMKDGSMFGELDLYLNESFYKEHPLISFDTLYEERAYEIVAVFRSQVYDDDDDVFKYYQFYEAETQDEFDDFYNNIKELSLYDTGVEAEFGDTFLTLSTCAYHVKDGRLAVVAKRVE